MFSSKAFARLAQPIQRFCTASIKFGDPRMPDKLYKSINLLVKSAEPAVIESYKTFVLTAASHLNIEVTDVETPKKPHFFKTTQLKSIRGHRKHLVQYEVRTYSSNITLENLTGSTADTFLEYIERMLPEGVSLDVRKCEIEPLPYYLTPEHVKGDSKVEESTPERVKGDSKVEENSQEKELV